MIDVERSEVRRYLGYRAPMQTDETLEPLIDEALAALYEAAQPKSVFQPFPLTHPAAGTVSIDGLLVRSRNLSHTLQDCTVAYLMAATLGAVVDRLIARISATRMSAAVVYQAAAAAMIESFCDQVNNTLREEAAKQQLYCRPRFSPGYGDFKIEHQRDFARLLDTPRKIGLTVTEACLLAPVKSVTAVIGLSAKALPCVRQGCEACDKKDCAYRRN